MNFIDYSRLSELGDKVKGGIATKKEKDEFMLLLYQDGKITPQQYNDYANGRNSDELINAGLAVGAVILMGYLVSQIFKK